MMATAEASLTVEPSTARLAAGRIPDPPYTGIRPFEEHEWPIFFGREAIVDELLARLSRDRFVAIIGASGSGKSSLVKAGLFATLKHKHARLGIRWQTVTMRPAGSPLWSLAEALQHATAQGCVDANQPAPIVEVEPHRAALARGRHAIAAILREQQFPSSQNLLLLVDQFEELFRYEILGGETEIGAFLDQLIDVVDEPLEGFYIALTMRSDFLGDCARFTRFADALNRSSYLLRRMTENELADAIVLPAELLGGRVEPDLLQRLLQDAQGEQDHLVLLQHALTWLWTRERDQFVKAGRPEAPLVLSLAEYQAVGGMAGALSQHTNAIYDELGGPQAAPERHQALQLATKRLFQCLVDVGDHGRATRRPLRFAQLSAETGLAPDLLTEVIDAFRAPGRAFLVPAVSQPIDESTVIDVSHEALIRQWDKLTAPKGWLSEEQADAEAWRQLCARIRAYIRNPRRLLNAEEIEEFGNFWRRRGASTAWLRRYSSPGAPDVTGNDGDSAGITTEKVDKLLKVSRRRERRRKLTFRTLAAFVFVALLGLVTSGTALYYFYRERELRLTTEVARAAAQVADINAMVSLEESKRATTDATQSAKQLRTELARLADALVLTETDSKTAHIIVQTVRALDEQADTLATAGQRSAPPRLYIQIADEMQGPIAQELATKLARVRIGDGFVVVPEVQITKDFDSKSVLRCFRDQECQTDGPLLLAAINQLLTTPKVTLEDLSSRYGQQSTALMPRHFELWFGPGQIALALGR